MCISPSGRKKILQTGVMKWWHGDGSLLDYSNPDAVSWWHRQLDNVLDLGVDGFKCDGTDPYILELIRPMGQKGTGAFFLKKKCFGNENETVYI